VVPEVSSPALEERNLETPLGEIEGRLLRSRRRHHDDLRSSFGNDYTSSRASITMSSNEVCLSSADNAVRAECCRSP
jgi:hypothetical protein